MLTSSVDAPAQGSNWVPSKWALVACSLAMALAGAALWVLLSGLHVPDAQLTAVLALKLALDASAGLARVALWYPHHKHGRRYLDFAVPFAVTLWIAASHGGWTMLAVLMVACSLEATSATWLAKPQPCRWARRLFARLPLVVCGMAFGLLLSSLH
jgi:hypothetical protein